MALQDAFAKVAQGLAGVGNNPQASQEVGQWQQNRAQQQNAPAQASLAAHALAVNGLRQKLASLQPGTPEYHDTLDQMQENIHGMREIVAPDQKRGPMDWLERHTTDRLHITNHDARMKQLLQRQQAGVAQDRQTAQNLAQGTPQAPPPVNPLTQKYNQAREAALAAGKTPEEAGQLAFESIFPSPKTAASKPAAPLEAGGVMYGVRGPDGKEYLASDMEKPTTPPEVKELFKTVKGAQTEKQAQADKKQQEAESRFNRALSAREQDKGTWVVDEGPDGKPVLFNSKTGELRAAPEGMHKSGYYDKNIAPLEAAKLNITDYITSGTPNGPDDLALQHEFFTATQPATGFRMTKVQQDALLNARSVWEGMKAKVQHTATGIMFSDEQRKQIADAALRAIAAKQAALSGGNQSAEPKGGGSKDDPLGLFK